MAVRVRTKIGVALGLWAAAVQMAFTAVLALLGDDEVGREPLVEA